MWYIVMQSSASITCIYLTSSKSKCKKEYERLESEVEAKEDERYTFYYMGYCKTGCKVGYIIDKGEQQ